MIRWADDGATWILVKVSVVTMSNFSSFQSRSRVHDGVRSVVAITWHPSIDIMSYRWRRPCNVVWRRIGRCGANVTRILGTIGTGCICFFWDERESRDNHQQTDFPHFFFSKNRGGQEIQLAGLILSCKKRETPYDTKVTGFCALLKYVETCASGYEESLKLRCKYSY